jgi:two-component system invasion response regulator UvrY
MRAGLKRLIEEEGDITVTAEAGSGDEAVRLAREHRAGVAVLDTCIGDPGVLETSRLLGRADEALNILALGDRGCGPLPARILELGVSGYLSKQADGAEIRQAIRKLSNGGRHVCAEVAQHMVFSAIDGDGDLVDTLSDRELSVMLMLSEGHPRDEISHRLCITQKTVSTYRSRLLRKLGVRNDVDLAYLALRHGLVEPPVRVQLS